MKPFCIYVGLLIDRHHHQSSLSTSAAAAAAVSALIGCSSTQGNPLILLCNSVLTLSVTQQSCSPCVAAGSVCLCVCLVWGGSSLSIAVGDAFIQAKVTQSHSSYTLASPGRLSQRTQTHTSLFLVRAEWCPRESRGFTLLCTRTRRLPASISAALSWTHAESQFPLSRLLSFRLSAHRLVLCFLVKHSPGACRQPVG